MHAFPEKFVNPNWGLEWVIGSRFVVVTKPMMARQSYIWPRKYDTF